LTDRTSNKPATMLNK